MNKILLSSLLAMLIFTGCDDGEITNLNNTDDEYTQNDERSDSDSDDDHYEEENDNENEDDDDDNENDDNNENNEIHNQGASCLTCHGISSGTVEYDKRFTSGGTVYTAINSVSGYATGYKIRLVLENTPTTIDYRIDKGDGNSYTEYSINTASKYTAQVINTAGTVVNSSTTNSHDGARLDCNVCHTVDGTAGAPGRITSFDYYASIASVVATTDTTTTTENNTTTTVVDTTLPTSTTTISFASAVMPVLESKCKVCHTVGGLNEQFSITDSASTYTNVSTNGYTNTTSVDSSLLLTKGIGISHAGNAPLINSSSTEYQTIRDWISQGALNN